MAIQNRNTTLPGIWASTAQTTIPTPPVAGVTYRDTTLNSTAIDKAWPFKTIVDSSDFNQHAFLQDTLIKEAEQYGVMRWNNTTTYKEGGFCLGQDGKLYQAKRDNQGKEPTSNTDDWKVFTSGGGFPIGSIGYTLRTEVPEGGAWCDGAEYTQAMFPDIYQMLVDGKLQSTTVSEFDSSVSANGSCGFFGLDTANERFKVPLLKDVYLKAGQAPSMFGAESLPNIIAGVSNDIAAGDDSDYTGAIKLVSAYNNPFWAGATNVNRGRTWDFNASRSSSTYQDGAKVNPDHVTYRAYVVLYASAAEASVAQAQEFMTAVSNLNTAKANTDLSNVSSNIDYVVESGTNYMKYKSGKLICWGTIPASPRSQTITFPKPFVNTDYGMGYTQKGGASATIGRISFEDYHTSSVTVTGIYANNAPGKWIAIGQGA